MGWKRPLFGDGELVWVDTPVEPARTPTPAEVEAAFPGALALAEQVARDFAESQYQHDRGTVELMTAQNIRGGLSPERARQIAVTAVRRIHGDTVPYSHRS